MGSEQYPLRQIGIYRNLPAFDPSITGLQAVVVGATGISGFNTLRSLLASSKDRWATIYALSRRPLSDDMLSLLSAEQRARIQHVPIDLTSSHLELSSRLKDAGVTAEYVFFYGYIHPSSISAMDPKAEEELAKANIPAFQNFLKALPLANVHPKRILLQTGGKHYGVQIGRARTPYLESDPGPRNLSRNFYYGQEELLEAYCQKNPNCSWNVIRPFAVIGATLKASMSVFMPYAVYAAVSAKKNEPIFFGGDIEEWQYELLHSSARLTGFLSEWAVLEDKCKNQAFNAHDGSPLSWDRFFEELARWYGVEKGIEGPELDDSTFSSIVLAGGKQSPLGYGPPTAIKLSRTLAEWAKDESNAETWKLLMKESNGQLKVDAFTAGLDVVMADFALHRVGQPSSAKLRRFGFNGFVDSVESIFEMYKDMAVLGLLPPPRVEAARPQI